MSVATTLDASSSVEWSTTTATTSTSTSTTTQLSQNVTRYVLTLNESDLLELYDRVEANHPLYVHNYVAVALLTALTIASFGCNAALAAAFANQQTTLRTPFRHALIGLNVLHTIDVLFDGCVAIAYTTRVIWDLGFWLCRANAFMVNFWLLVLPCTLLHAAAIILFDGDKDAKRIDARWPRNDVDGRRRRRRRCRVAWITVGLTWTLAAFLIAALLQMPWLTERPYPARMSCSLVPSSSSSHVSHNRYIDLASKWLLPVMMCVLPISLLALMAVCLATILWRDRQLKRRIAHLSTARSNIGGGGGNRIAIDAAMRPRLSNHDIRSLFVTWFALFAVYSFGAFPYAIHVHFERIFVGVNDDDDRWTKSRWEVCRTPIADVLFSWIRLLVPSIQSTIVFVFDDDLRHDFATAVFWWRRPGRGVAHFGSSGEANSVNVTSRVMANNGHYNKRSLIKDGLKFLRGTTTGDVQEVDPSIPVLFVSSQGLCLRKRRQPRAIVADASDGSGKFVCKFNDLVADCCRHGSTNSHEKFTNSVDGHWHGHGHDGGHDGGHGKDRLLGKRSRSASPRSNSRVAKHSRRHRQTTMMMTTTTTATTTNYNKSIKSRDVSLRNLQDRERELKIGVWPQAARFSGPRNDTDTTLQQQYRTSAVSRPSRPRRNHPRPASYS